MGVEDGVGPQTPGVEGGDQSGRHLGEHHGVDDERVGGSGIEDESGVGHARFPLSLQHRNHAVGHLAHLLIRPVHGRRA